MNRIKAEIIADSINTHGQRITTFVCTFPRIILAELNTHRMLSRNSASSRAIPFETLLQKVREEPFIPIAWMKEHKGMQGTEFITDSNSLHYNNENWLRARDNAIKVAKDLANYGLTKQICNRLLEPFLYHTAIITATDWENFFALRAHEAAEIHIQDLAYKMLEAYNKSIPNLLQPGQWHIPFGDQIVESRIPGFNDTHYVGWLDDQKLKIATARCARISYNTFEGKDDYEADIKLHDRLASSGHWSPFEHCAKAAADDPTYFRSGVSGNFRGFIQYRKLFNNENRTDARVKKTFNLDASNTEQEQPAGGIQASV